MMRTLYKSDIPQILVIEKSVHVAPWTDDTFTMCFKSGYFGWAVEEEGRIIGFIIISLTKEECHVLNLCVVHEHQHQGWGRKMLKHALSHARQHGVGIAYLEVRRSNTRAISLYRKMEFHLVGERKDYYPTVAGNEDALIFAMSLHLPLDDQI